MRSLYLLMFFISIVTTSHSQSKIETERWLVGKLNAANTSGILYSARSGEVGEIPSSTTFINDNKFKIDSGYLIITNIWEDKNKPDGIKTISRYLVPLSDVTEFKASTNFDLLTLGTKTYSIITYRNNKKLSSTQNFVNFGLNLKFEENLLERLNKALEHLKQFYPKKKKVELF